MSAFVWTDREVRRALRGREGPTEGTYGRVSTDSRAIGSGDLFVALVGDRFDGHDFLTAVAAAGAGGAVVLEAHRESAARLGLTAYGVSDTLVALGDLARHRRRALEAAVVGITGSSGKTTTKEFARGALAGTLRTHATTGNLNNRIGLPRTLLDAPTETQAVLLEMGTSLPGEISTLAHIAEPGIGVVTTVGEAHLEGLGSLRGVLEEKVSLLSALPSDGVGIVGDEPESLATAARRSGRGIRVAGWSARADTDLRPLDVQMDESGCYGWSWRGEAVHLRVPGRVAVTDALLALAVSEELGVPAQEAARGVSRVTPLGMRGQVRKVGELTVLVDCYNANPQSMVTALEVLVSRRHDGPRVAVLGSMLELGHESAALHRRVLTQFLDSSVDQVALTGEFVPVAADIPTDDRVFTDEDVMALGAKLVERLSGHELVLLKASRGARLERMIEVIEAAFGTDEEA